MTLSRCIHRALRTLAVFANLSCGLAYADDKYPSSPIRLVVPFDTSGSTNLIAQHAGAQQGQPIVIENRGGTEGSLGMANDLEVVMKGDIIMDSVFATVAPRP